MQILILSLCFSHCFKQFLFCFLFSNADINFVSLFLFVFDFFHTGDLADCKSRKKDK